MSPDERSTRSSLGSTTLFGLLSALVLLLVGTVLWGVSNREATYLLVAAELVDHGHWAVPYRLGSPVPVLPGFSWGIGLFSWAYGGVSSLAGRMPSLVSWMLLGVVLWRLSNSFEQFEHRVLTLISGLLAPVFLLWSANAALPVTFFTLCVFLAVLIQGQMLDGLGHVGGTIVAHLLLAGAILMGGILAYPWFYVPFFATTRGEDTGWPELIGGFLLTHLVVGGWLGYLGVRAPELMGLFLESAMVPELATVGFEEVLIRLVAGPLLIFILTLPGSYLLIHRWPGLGESGEGTGKATGSALGCILPLVIVWWTPGLPLVWAAPAVPWVAYFAGRSLPGDAGQTNRILLSMNRYFGVGYLLVPLALLWVTPTYDIVPFPFFLAGVTLVVLAGGGIMTAEYWPGDPLPNQLSALVSACLLLLLSYLCLYVPTVDPGRMANEHRLRQYARQIHDRVEDQTVAYLPDGEDQIPFYLYRQGVTVRATGGTVPEQIIPAIAAGPDRLGPRWMVKYHLRLSDRPTYYFYIPRSI